MIVGNTYITKVSTMLLSQLEEFDNDRRAYIYEDRQDGQVIGRIVGEISRENRSTTLQIEYEVNLSSPNVSRYEKEAIMTFLSVVR
jgi:hypothetical protein